MTLCTISKNVNTDFIKLDPYFMLLQLRKIKLHDIHL